MKTFFNINLILAILGMGGSALAQSNGVPSPEDYPAFSHFITDRNIFDPNRQPHFYDSRHSYRPSHVTQRGTPGIQFVGTMSYAKGWFAFFSGTTSDLSKVSQTGSSIAGYTVANITATSVVLESTNKDQVVLNVGQGLRHENGKWIFSDAGELPAADSSSTTSASSSTDSSGSSASSSSTPNTPPPSTGEPNDVLKRLMQQREKENQ